MKKLYLTFHIFISINIIVFAQTKKHQISPKNVSSNTQHNKNKEKPRIAKNNFNLNLVKDLEIESGEIFYIKDSTSKNWFDISKDSLLDGNSKRDYISIFNGGMLELGNKRSDAAKYFIVSIPNGSSLYIDGVLNLNENSRLIIEPGAHLVIGPNAVINLLGHHSILEIQGAFELLDYTNFNAKSLGYIIFNEVDKKQPVSIYVGMDCTMTFESLDHQKILELKNCKLHIPEHLGLIKICNSVVNLDNKSAIIPEGCSLFENGILNTLP